MDGREHIKYYFKKKKYSKIWSPVHPLIKEDCGHYYYYHAEQREWVIYDEFNAPAVKEHISRCKRISKDEAFLYIMEQ